MGRVYELAKAFDRRYPGGVSWRMKKHCDVVESYLNPGEEPLYAFCAQKNDKFYDLFSTCAFCLTNKRILIARKRMLWGSFLYSVTPDMYNDSEIYRGLMWGKLTIDTIKEVIIITNLPKSGLDEIETTISDFMIKEKQKFNNRDE